MTATPNDSSLERNTVLYIVALREQLSASIENDPIHKKIMATRDNFVKNDMFDPDEAMAEAVDKRKFLLKELLEDQGRFSSSDDDQCVNVIFM